MRRKDKLFGERSLFVFRLFNALEIEREKSELRGLRRSWLWCNTRQGSVFPFLARKFLRAL